MQESLFDSSFGVTAKRCPKCLITKNVREFARRGLRSYSPNSYCLECQRIYCRAHYRRNKAKHNARRHVNQVAYMARNKRLMRQYLVGRGCVDCGNTNPVVFEFDHVRGIKRYEVSIMLNGGFAWARILEEAAKCEIRCANCHRIKTAAQLNWKGRETEKT